MNGFAQSAPPPNPFLDALCARLGLGFAMQRYAAAEPAIREKMRRRSRCPDAFLADLERDPKLFQDIIESVIVTETHFFRHPQHFEFLRDKVLPNLASSDRTLRVWSAGCSTGEEPYSLAIMLHQLGLSNRAEILATDISHNALETAQKAVYRAWSLRGVEEWPGASRYFQQLSGGDYRLAREVASLVSFRHLNLACPWRGAAVPLPGTIDIVLCRNVLIYMTTEASANIVQRLLETLAPGGWLIPGPSDPVAGRGLRRPVVTPHGIFYRREPRPEDVTGVVEPLLWASPQPDALVRPERTANQQRREVVHAAPARSPHRKGSTIPSKGRGAGSFRAPGSCRAPARDEPAKPQRMPEDLEWEVGRLVNAGLAEEACDLAQAETERKPLRSEGHYLVAFVHWHLGHLEAALVSVGKALYLEPDCAVAHQVQGLLLAQQGRAVEARRAFRTAYWLASRLPCDAALYLGRGATAAELARAARLQLRGLQGSGSRDD